MQQIPLEDNFSDVIGKAAAGIGLNATALAQRAGLDEIRVLQVLDGKFESVWPSCSTCTPPPFLSWPPGHGGRNR